MARGNSSWKDLLSRSSEISISVTGRKSGERLRTRYGSPWMGILFICCR